MKNYYIKSRYGDTYCIREENRRWYYDCTASRYVRSFTNKDGDLEMVDPIGGPTVCKDDFLNHIDGNLPQLKVLAISFDRDRGMYELHT